ncbi:MAG: flagellar assembly protein FliH [Gammaproteobacteria bacterium]|nr:flagellar assembly protein FliH [Gammaproteobacteria bacterium]
MSSSKFSSGLIDGDELSAFERWELPVMAGGRQAAVEEVSPSEVSPVTAEQIEQIQQQARKEGFERGRRDGLQAARKEVDATLQRLEQIIHALAEPLQAVDEQVEGELMQLAIAIARQLIRRELQSDAEQVIGVVREALAALPSAARKVRVHLHPEDAVLVREKLQPAEEAEVPWRIVDDLTLTRGGCRIESATSRIDASVEQRINSVVAELLGGTRSVDDDRA